MKDLTELRNMLDHAQNKPIEQTVDCICDVLDNLIDHIERIDKAASCLANGIQPD